MLSAIAATRKGLRHTGSFNRLSFSDSEFMASNNSIVTRMDKLMVVARCTMTLVNISQPTQISRTLVEVSLYTGQVSRKERTSKRTTYKLVEGNPSLRSTRVHEPPSITKNHGASDIRPDDKVPDEQPFSDKRFATVPWWKPHDRMVRRVES